MTPKCTCTCACACACASSCLLCGAVSRRVSRVVARYFLFVVRESLVVDCPSLCCALLFCVVACCCRCGLLLVVGMCLRMPYPAPVCCLTCCFLQDQVVTLGAPEVHVTTVFFSFSLLSLFPLSHTPVCTFKTSRCVPAPRPHAEKHVRVLLAYTGTL